MQRESNALPQLIGSGQRIRRELLLQVVQVVGVKTVGTHPRGSVYWVKRFSGIVRLDITEQGRRVELLVQVSLHPDLPQVSNVGVTRTPARLLEKPARVTSASHSRI